MCCRRELQVDLPGGVEAWLVVELNELSIRLTTESRRSTSETLSLAELQLQYPNVTRRVARTVAEMICGSDDRCY
jgi:hypothetical protein